MGPPSVRIYALSKVFGRQNKTRAKIQLRHLSLNKAAPTKGCISWMKQAFYFPSPSPLLPPSPLCVHVYTRTCVLLCEHVPVEAQELISCLPKSPSALNVQRQGFSYSNNFKEKQKQKE